MANNSIGKWSAQASLDAGGFASGIKGMESSLKGFVQGPNGLGLLTSLPAALGITSIEGVFSRLNDTLENELELGFLNDQLGTSIEFLSTLRTVASENSVGADQFAAGMARMNQVLGQAILGSEAEIATLQRLGLTIDSIRTQGFEENFRQAARGLANIEDRSVRARTAMELFGRQGGGNMLRFVQDIDRAFADVQARGGFTTEEDLRRFKEMDDAIDRMTTAWENMWRRVASSQAGWLTSLMNGLSGQGTSMVADAAAAAQESQTRLALAQVMDQFRQNRAAGDLDRPILAPQGLNIAFRSPNDIRFVNLDAIQNQVESLEALAAMDAASAAAEPPAAQAPAGFMLGMSAFGAVLQTATEAARNFANAQIAAARQAEAAMERLRGLVEQARSPLENFSRSFRDITTAGLNRTQMEVLLGQRVQELLDQVPSGQLSGAIRAGSVEDVTRANEAIARRLDGGPMDRVRQALEIANQQRLRQIELGRQLIEELRKQGTIEDIFGGAA